VPWRTYLRALVMMLVLGAAAAGAMLLGIRLDWVWMSGLGLLGLATIGCGIVVLAIVWLLSWLNSLAIGSGSSQRLSPWEAVVSTLTPEERRALIERNLQDADVYRLTPGDGTIPAELQGVLGPVMAAFFARYAAVEGTSAADRLDLDVREIQPLNETIGFMPSREELADPSVRKAVLLAGDWYPLWYDDDGGYLFRTGEDAIYWMQTHYEIADDILWPAYPDIEHFLFHHFYGMSAPHVQRDLAALRGGERRVDRTPASRRRLPQPLRKVLSFAGRVIIYVLGGEWNPQGQEIVVTSSRREWMVPLVLCVVAGGIYLLGAALDWLWLRLVGVGGLILFGPKFLGYAFAGVVIRFRKEEDRSAPLSAWEATLLALPPEERRALIERNLQDAGAYRLTPGDGTIPAALQGVLGPVMAAFFARYAAVEAISASDSFGLDVREIQRWDRALGAHLGADALSDPEVQAYMPWAADWYVLTSDEGHDYLFRPGEDGILRVQGLPAAAAMTTPDYPDLEAFLLERFYAFDARAVRNAVSAL
jgi:hypothetical protein